MIVKNLLLFICIVLTTHIKQRWLQKNYQKIAKITL